MAYANKECTIVILDVRVNACDKLKKYAVKATAEILKDKICTAKNDYISFVLLGTKETQNEINENFSGLGYFNITEYPMAQLATWKLLINFFKFIKENETCNGGDWLDALVVAMGMLKSASETFKIQRKRIVLFCDFNDSLNDTNFDSFDLITRNLLENEVQLFVVSDSILYVDNPTTGGTTAIFAPSDNKTQSILENEKYVLRLQSHCNTKLLNFAEALRTIFKFETARPWVWNSKLCIGTKIVINISGVIAIKNQSNIKLKKRWGEADEIMSRELRYFIKGNPVEPLEKDLIDGYMLGSTPIPYDESMEMEDKVPNAVGLTFIGFAKRETVPEVYFCGDSMYWIVHRRDMLASARKVDALVKAMLADNILMLCWRVFSEKFNNPKLVALIPNPLDTDKPASLWMVELSYYSQHHYWDFPKLSTQKTQCTPEQTAAIDELIDSMDLMIPDADGNKPRQSMKKDLLPFDCLPHIYEQNVLDILERKIISNAKDDDDDDEDFIKMLNEKNFVDVFWKVPEPNEEKSKTTAKKVKELFPLEDIGIEAWKKKPVAPAVIKPEYKTEISMDSIETMKPNCFAVGQETPAKDFDELVRFYVKPLKNNTERDMKFNQFAKQMREIVWHLIFDEEETPTKSTSSQVNYQKILEALRIYRKSCYEFNAFEDYNDWLKQIKSAVKEKHLLNFWKEIIVINNLGLCFVGEPLLEDRIAMEQFYELNCRPSYITEEEQTQLDADINELLASGNVKKIEDI